MNFSVYVYNSVCQSCSCVCWSPPTSKESVCVAAGYSDGILRIFRMSSSEMEMKLHPHRVGVTAVQYSANGEESLLTVDIFTFNVLIAFSEENFGA